MKKNKWFVNKIRGKNLLNLLMIQGSTLDDGRQLFLFTTLPCLPFSLILSRDFQQLFEICFCFSAALVAIRSRSSLIRIDRRVKGLLRAFWRYQDYPMTPIAIGDFACEYFACVYVCARAFFSCLQVQFCAFPGAGFCRCNATFKVLYKLSPARVQEGC